jgi:RHS repeat-associated protein
MQFTSAPRKFTSKERDAETGLDYFGARYYSGAQGRFTSVDPIGIMKQKLVDPQQWNDFSNRLEEEINRKLLLLETSLRAWMAQFPDQRHVIQTIVFSFTGRGKLLYGSRPKPPWPTPISPAPGFKRMPTESAWVLCLRRKGLCSWLV